MDTQKEDQAAPTLALPTPYTDAVLERYKAELQHWLESHKRDHAESVEMFKSVIQMGQNALKAVFLMNAGAAAALLTFIGHLATHAPKEVPAFADSLTAFVTGLLLAGLASGLSYGCQWLYLHHPESSSGGWVNIAAVVSVALSLVAFATGIYFTYQVFSAFNLAAAV